MKPRAQYTRESRARRAAAGGKVVTVVLTPMAAAALNRWTVAGWRQIDAISEALVKYEPPQVTKWPT